MTVYAALLLPLHGVVVKMQGGLVYKAVFRSVLNDSVEEPLVLFLFCFSLVECAYPSRACLRIGGHRLYGSATEDVYM